MTPTPYKKRSQAKAKASGANAKAASAGRVQSAKTVRPRIFVGSSEGKPQSLKGRSVSKDRRDAIDEILERRKAS